MRKSLHIVLIFALLLTTIIAKGQCPVSDEFLKTIIQQIDDKQYDDVIGSAGVILNRNDITYEDNCLWLMDCVGMAYYYKGQKEESVSIFKDAIGIAEKKEATELLPSLYYNYLAITRDSRQYEEELFREYSLKLLLLPKNSSFNKYLELYGDGFHLRCKKYIDDKKEKAKFITGVIEKDSKELAKLNSMPYYIYQLQAIEYSDNDFIKASNLFEKAINGYLSTLKYHPDKYYEKWLGRCFSASDFSGIHSFPELLLNHGYVESACLFQKKYIDYLKSIDENYIATSKEPRELSDNVLNNIAFLQAAQRFSEVSAYCHEVMVNPLFEEIEMDTSDYLSALYDKKNILLKVAENPRRRITPGSFKFDDEIYQNINNNMVDFCFPYIYSSPFFLIHDKNLNDAWEQIEDLQDYLHHDLPISMKDWLTYDDTITAKTFEEYLVSMGRYNWDADGMGFETWLACCRLAYLYFFNGDTDNAIKWQTIACNIVDNQWDPDYFDLYNMLDNNIGIAHINFEFDNYHQLAFLCNKCGQYDKAYDYYTRIINQYLAVVQKVFLGSDIYKEKNWELHKPVLSSIISEIIQECDNYPPFGDIVMELSALQKGFLAWQKIALKSITEESNNKEATMLLNKELSLEKEMELLCYQNNYKRAPEAVYLEQANCDAQLRDLLGLNSILENTILDIDEIKNALESNEIYVDFIEMPLGDTINYLYKITKQWYSFITNPRIVESKFDHAVYYAVLMRKNWEYPKVVFIGNNLDSPLESLVVYKLNENDKKDLNEQKGVINSIYTDTELSHFIWDTIITAGNIKDNENIYYIPSGLLTKIGLENLSFNKNEIVSERYNVYRLSSARELLKKKSKIDNNNDICYGIGGLKYNDMPFERFGIRRSTAQSSLFSRDSLVPLFGSRTELLHLKESFGSHAITTSGEEGTERHVLQQLEKLKPAILHISTHGFNCINRKLDADEEKFLFGNRDNYVSPMENSLYRTGLYLSPSQNRINQSTSDGILTAKEISMMDLSQTKLVVLSSCSSALGTVNSEGVYGLQRGLKLSGAESLLVSLWDVDDNSTEILMKEFYRQLSLGKTRREALLKAQDAVKNYDDDMDDTDIGNYKTFEAPYYWAGFVLIDGNE